jgi:hypothetical protein
VDTTTIDSIISTTKTTSLIITSTCTANAESTSFYLQATGARVGGQFITLPGAQDETVQSSSFTSNFLNAAQFTLDGSSRLLNDQYGANTENFAELAEVFFDALGTFPAFAVTYLTCSTTGLFAGPLTCTGYSGASTFHLCPSGCISANGEPCSGLGIGAGLDSSCQAISLTAVPSCSVS